MILPLYSVSSQWCLVKTKKQWAQAKIQETPCQRKKNLSYCEVDQTLEQAAQREVIGVSVLESVKNLNGDIPEQPALSSRVRQDDVQSSLTTSVILWLLPIPLLTRSQYTFKSCCQRISHHENKLPTCSAVFSPQSYSVTETPVDDGDA